MTIVTKRTLTAAASLSAWAWCVDARATPDFPGAVEMALMLPAGSIASMVDPPDGCRLCHVNGSQGGDPLTTFGTLMKANGAVAYQGAATTPGAIAAIQAMAPKLIADLKKGTDPNSDMSVMSTDPVPEYGCGSIVAGGGRGGRLAPCLIFAALFVVRRWRWASRTRRSNVSIV
jgi:hypothetical protein